LATREPEKHIFLAILGKKKEKERNQLAKFSQQKQH
jgi:hypothetical protein